MILENDDLAIKLIAIETLGVVAESSEGKILLSTTSQSNFSSKLISN